MVSPVEVTVRTLSIFIPPLVLTWYVPQLYKDMKINAEKQIFIKLFIVLKLLGNYYK